MNVPWKWIAITLAVVLAVVLLLAGGLIRSLLDLSLSFF